MIKVKMITEDKDFIYVGDCQSIAESLKVDYFIWKATHKECVFEYKGHTCLICQEASFVENEIELENWLKDIEGLIIY